MSEENDQNRGGPRWLWVAFILSMSWNALNLAGLADTIITWRDFFREGVLVHYLSVKSVVLNAIPAFVRPPEWFLDYIVFGGTVAIGLDLWIARRSTTSARIPYWMKGLIVLLGPLVIVAITVTASLSTAGIYAYRKNPQHLKLLKRKTGRKTSFKKLIGFARAIWHLNYYILLSTIPMLVLILIASDLIKSW